MDDSVEWTENVHAWATKVQKKLDEVLSEKDKVKRYEKSLEYNRLLDKPAQYKLDIPEYVNTSRGPQLVVVDEFGNKITRDSNGDFVGHI